MCRRLLAVSLHNTRYGHRSAGILASRSGRINVIMLELFA
jgi:hypothetical protein